METISAFSNLDVFIHLGLALVLGMILGIERLYAHKTATMRTYAMVSMGAALFVIVARMAALTSGSINPLIVVAQIVSGIGFLGAGLIIFKDSRITGITTASGLWVAAGIGMASGFGFHILAAMTTAMALFIFTVLWIIEQKLRKILPGEEDEKN